MPHDLEKLKKLTKTLTSNGYLTNQAASWEYAFDSVKACVCITNTDFKLKYINKPLRNKLNLQINEFINRDLYSLFVGESILRELDTDEEVVEYLDLFIRVFNGWYDFQRHDIKTGNNRLIGYLYIFMDVTQKRLAVEALKKSESNYRFLFESMLDGFALHKMLFNEEGQPYDYEFLNVNPAFEKIIGLTSKQLIGHTCLSIFPKLAQNWFDVYTNVVQTGKSYRASDYSAKSGEYYDIIVFRPMPGHFACIIADITDRKVVEKDLKSTNILLNGVLDAIPDPIVVLDDDYTVIKHNKAAKELLNVTSNKIEGSKCFELLGNNKVCDECQTKIAKETKKPAKLLRFVKKWDKLFDCRSYPIIDEYGNVTKIIEHLRDVT